VKNAAVRTAFTRARYPAPVTRLRDETAVECPVVETLARMEAHFLSRRSVDGVTRMRLRVPVAIGNNSLGLVLSREVRVEAWSTRENRNLHQLVCVAWAPEGMAAVPTFEGTLAVWGEGTPERSHIELEGSYRLPLGSAGQAFDATIGHRIAASTARELLEDLKRAIEHR
jgi:hypothetical protein